MSLFPAYSREDDRTILPGSEEGESSSSQGGKVTQAAWLNCSSFPKNAVEILGNLQKIENRKRKHEKRNKEESLSTRHQEKLFFYEDTNEVQPVPSVPQVQLTKPIRPVRKENVDKKKRRKKTKTIERYFNSKQEILDENEAGSISIDEFTKRTADLNKRIREDSQDIKLWLDYVQLQDLGEGSKRGKTEKKLSILDKALEKNLDSEELLQQKMIEMEKIYPYDKLNSEAKLILSKHPSFKTGWKWLVSSVQFNLSKMTAPGVLEIYSSILQRVHRQPSEFIIDVILECGLFLRQAGLWEQLWTFIQIYLDMCFTVAGSGAFKLNTSIPEKDVCLLEDKVITSGLTLSELWLRVEHLRSGVFFLPLTSDQESLAEDPQRMVLPEDLSNLLYPLAKTCRARLAITVLILLKVPPLLYADYFFDYIGLKNINWSIESSEVLFSHVASPYGIVKREDGYFDVLRELVVSPQYLVDRVGDVQFLESIDYLFQLIIKHCQQDIQSLIVWQIRWWRLIIRVKNYNGKSYASKAKKLLKQYREFIPLYTEYALLEEEIGHFEVSQKVLETTIQLHDSPMNLGSVDKAHLCTAYRIFVEMLLRKDFQGNQDKVKSLLVALSFGESTKNIQSTSEELCLKGLERFRHVTTELIHDVAKEYEENKDKKESYSLDEIAVEPYLVSWIACNVWLSYVTTGRSISAGQILQQALDKLKFNSQQPLSRIKLVVEGIYEIYIDLLHHSLLANPSEFSLLCDVLSRAVILFPNNTKFLHILGSIKIKGLKWKTLSSSLISTGSQIAALFSFLILHSQQSEDSQGTLTRESIFNRMKSQLMRLVGLPGIERCPLIWRLLLQCSSPLPPDELRKTYYRALEKCPWVKILYYEAGKILPQDLPEIQDLLVEKELRLYITPEELEILREDSISTIQEEDTVKS